MRPRLMIVKTAHVVEGNLWTLFPIINVDRVTDIPCDYPGPMGVPITFMGNYNPKRFQLLGRRGHLKMPNGREVYQRIFVRNLKPVLPEEIDLADWFERMGIHMDVEMLKDAEPGTEIEPIYRSV